MGELEDFLLMHLVIFIICHLLTFITHSAEIHSGRIQGLKKTPELAFVTKMSLNAAKFQTL